MYVLPARVLRLLRQANKRVNFLFRAKRDFSGKSFSRCQFATCGVERESNIEIPDRKRVHLLILGNSGENTRGATCC